jgi:NhaP-type Na+/H+ or K+/H+ antiporter
MGMGKGKQEFSQGAELGFAFGRFLTIFGGSLVLGAILGLVSAFILKRQATINDEENN